MSPASGIPLPSLAVARNSRRLCWFVGWNPEGVSANAVESWMLPTPYATWISSSSSTTPSSSSGSSASGSVTPFSLAASRIPFSQRYPGLSHSSMANCAPPKSPGFTSSMSITTAPFASLSVPQRSPSTGTPPLTLSPVRSVSTNCS
jgi:hypothetical protein